jgi:hypothetical protein
MSFHRVHSVGVVVKNKSFAATSVLDHHPNKLLCALLSSSSSSPPPTTITTTKTTYECIITVTSIYSVENSCLSNTLNDCASGQIETSGRPAETKVCIDSFHPIRILGEGGFGKVILAKKKASEKSDERFAVKVMKKSHIINCCSVTYTVTEKEALVLASGHPFITTLYSCFQTKVIFNFLYLLHISRESLILKFTISMKT